MKTFVASAFASALLLGAMGRAEQVTYSAARSSGRLDANGLSARDQAMGNAMAAAGQGPGAFVSNSALLAGAGQAAALDYNGNLFFSRTVLSVSQGFSGFSGGASLAYADFGPISGLNADGIIFNERPYQISLSLGLGKALENSFSIGAGINSLSQNFGFFGTKSAFGGSLGLAWMSRGFKIGVAQDLESDLDRAAQVFLTPFRASAAYGASWLESQNATLAGQIDYDYVSNRVARAGLENLSFGMLALRGGYEIPIGVGFGEPQWTAGLGLVHGQWQLDLSYGGRESLGNARRASFTWRGLPQPKAVQAPLAANLAPASGPGPNPPAETPGIRKAK